MRGQIVVLAIHNLVIDTDWELGLVLGGLIFTILFNILSLIVIKRELLWCSIMILIAMVIAPTYIIYKMIQARDLLYDTETQEAIIPVYLVGAIALAARIIIYGLGITYIRGFDKGMREVHGIALRKDYA